MHKADCVQGFHLPLLAFRKTVKEVVLWADPEGLGEHGPGFGQVGGLQQAVLHRHAHSRWAPPT